MTGSTRQKFIKGVDHTAVGIFLVLAFFLPISKAIIEISFCMILFCFIVKTVFCKPSLDNLRVFFSNRINLSLLIFYLCIGLSLFASGPLFLKSFKAWFFKWGEGVLLFYFAQVFLKKEHIKSFVLIFLTSSLLIGIDGLYQKVTGIDFIRKNGLVGLDEAGQAIRATFNHYNSFATWLIVMFFINFGFIMSLKKIRLKTLMSPILLLIMLNFIFTNSRAGWLSFLVVCVIFSLFYFKGKTRLLLVGFLVFFLIAIASTEPLRERFLWSFQERGDADRLKLWKVSFLMFKSSPIVGKGIGLFMHYFPKYSTMNIQYAHNCYLQILAETGILGFLSFFWFLWEIILKAIKNIKNQENDFLFSGMFAAFTAFLIHSFFDVQLYSLQLATLFWLLLILINLHLPKERIIVSNLE